MRFFKASLFSAIVLYATHNFAADLPNVCGGGTYLREVTVSSSSQLQWALKQAQAGDLIKLADGNYRGQFVATKSGSANSRITLCGSRASVLDGGSYKKGYGFHLKGSYWTLTGFTVRNSQKGIVLDRASHNILRKLIVADVGQEAVHFRIHSSNNILRESLIQNTGLVDAGYGEGVYVGSAKSNWKKLTGNKPDKSDYNKVLYNRIVQTRAECVDIKEGTTGTMLEGNHFDGSFINGANYADSWVDVKGNDVIIRGNVGRNSGYGLLDGYQTHVNVKGTGQRPRFENNDSEVNGKGFAIKIHSDTVGAVVSCSNIDSKAASGLSNIKCVNLE